MESKNNKYHIRFSLAEDKNSNKELPEPLEFDFESHDDIFRIISFLQESTHFEDKQQAVEFAIGLKLFSGVMIKNRDSELFKDFQPAFRSFMKKLKGK
ncbi:MAG: DUF3861 domain-containing protein [Tannerellaceae bacterium]|nr:DUF3861 domain-containing protein [Tannerellaceae bacterium]MCD8265419.1 DUF3861 domain-containing protein [Tannerellaceae bacterium]